jgi:hypothetical protein
MSLDFLIAIARVFVYVALLAWADDLRWAYPCASLREWPPRFPVRSDFPGAVGIPRQLDHVAFDLNRVSPLVIAGLDPAIYAEKTLRRPCRDGFDSMRL